MIAAEFIAEYVVNEQTISRASKYQQHRKREALLPERPEASGAGSRQRPNRLGPDCPRSAPRGICLTIAAELIQRVPIRWEKVT